MVSKKGRSMENDIDPREFSTLKRKRIPEIQKNVKQFIA